MLTWIETGHGNPLLGTHLLGQDQELTEELNGTGVGDAGGADEQLKGLLQRRIGGNEG